MKINTPIGFAIAIAGTTIATCSLLFSILSASEPTAKPNVITSGALRFEEHLIMDKYTYAYGIATADLDGDGDLDISSADALPRP